MWCTTLHNSCSAHPKNDRLSNAPFFGPNLRNKITQLCGPGPQVRLTARFLAYGFLILFLQGFTHPPYRRNVENNSCTPTPLRKHSTPKVPKSIQLSLGISQTCRLVQPKSVHRTVNWPAATSLCPQHSSSAAPNLHHSWLSPCEPNLQIPASAFRWHKKTSPNSWA